ncbi:dipeptide ABC transporter ATP-binding protein [Microlunatus speluncae]|uniref:dipeptide ABC transporter ATP-binding protein n=1 Tax=Microlunatus speluncae TaxID=2594267 RepID=UPI0012667328|nr:ABC transporter ATP-binding protein [Microlunatus speluncae]
MIAPARTGGDVLRFEDLAVDFLVGGNWQRAVDGVSFALRRGEVLAVVGESGSGKSVTSLATIGLLPANARVSGRVFLDDQELLTAGRTRLAGIRGKRIAMIFQDPVNALDPVFTIGSQLIEMIRRHQPGTSRGQARERAVELLRMVEIGDPEQRLRHYPHQLSGGQCQRAMIAMALSCEPEVLIADEPTTALDVTVQQEVLDVLMALRRRTPVSIMIITHDMGVVADVAERVVVMRQGTVVEVAETRDLFARPEHDYTRTLLAAVPGRTRPDSDHGDPGGEPKPQTGPDDRAAATDQDRDPLMIKELVVEYRGRGRRIRAVAGVDLRLAPGEICGLVGESGSGKSTIGRSVLGMAPISGGEVRVGGVSLATAGRAELRAIRSRIGAVHQNPAGSLNPRYTIGQSIGEPLLVHRGVRGAELAGRVRALLESVELPGGWDGRYPHELSGGQRQRVSIARAIALEPELLIADEPTSALDVSVQARVLELLVALQRQFAFACLFISHDLAVVEQVCDRIAVMHDGLIVEQGSCESILRSPRDAYTRRLLEAAPVPDPVVQRRRREQRLEATAS